jgi:hypothetical protein
MAGFDERAELAEGLRGIFAAPNRELALQAAEDLHGAAQGATLARASSKGGGDPRAAIKAGSRLGGNCRKFGVRPTRERASTIRQSRGQRPGRKLGQVLYSDFV